MAGRRQRNADPELKCEGCAQLGAKHVCLDDRGLQAGVFLFCRECVPKLQYRTGDYVIRWYRIDESLPPSRKPHRDVDLWTRPRWGEEPEESAQEKKERERRERRRKRRERRRAGEEDVTSDSSSSESEDEADEADEGAKAAQEAAAKAAAAKAAAAKAAAASTPKLNLFQMMREAQEAGPMEAVVPPLKRFALKALADLTLSGARYGSFATLRRALHPCLQGPLLQQMVDNNRLRDLYKRRAAAEAAEAEAEARGDTLKTIDAHNAAQGAVEEHPEAKVTDAMVDGHGEADSDDSDAEVDVEAAALARAGARGSWKQFSKHFLEQLHTFVWDDEPPEIDLSSSGVGPRDLDLLCQTVAKQTVGSLSLKWNLLGSSNAGFLFALLACDRLHALDIGWNKLGDDGAQVLSSALARARSLRSLDMSGNGITKAGVRHICRGIGNSQSIQRLNLSFNPLGAEGATEIVEGGLGEAPLTHLGLRNCDLGQAGAVALAWGFRKNRHLQELMVADNRVTPEGARRIARNLKLSPGALLRAFGCGAGDRTAQHQRDTNKV